jgi:mannose-6-phosphate isomerase-like protein (cupin superfamily)
MAINIVDTLKLARENKKRTKIMDTRKMHAWVHYYPNPGDHDDLHCHPGDQTFLCLDGECTMSFPDGGKAVMKPGMVALIEGGSFYRLENTGAGPMILMGTRTGPNSANKHINYDTGKDIKGTTELVRGAGVADPRAHS